MRLRGIPNIAACPDSMSTLSSTIVSVRSSQRPVPASEPTRRMFRRPSRAQSGTGAGLGVGGSVGIRLGGTPAIAGAGVAVGGGVGESSSSGPKLASGMAQSPLGSAAESSPRNTAASVSSVSIPSAATEPWPRVATRSTASRPTIAIRPVWWPTSRRARRAMSQASRIANAWYASHTRSAATTATRTCGLRRMPSTACGPPPNTVPIPKPTMAVRTTSAGMAMRTPRRRAPAAYCPRPGNRRDRAAATIGERGSLFVTSTVPQQASIDAMVRSWTRHGPGSLRTLQRQRKRQRPVNAESGREQGQAGNPERTAWRTNYRLRRRPASRRKVDAPPDGVRMLAVRSMTTP